MNYLNFNPTSHTFDYAYISNLSNWRLELFHIIAVWKIISTADTDNYQQCLYTRSACTNSSTIWNKFFSKVGFTYFLNWLKLSNFFIFRGKIFWTKLSQAFPEFNKFLLSSCLYVSFIVFCPNMWTSPHFQRICQLSLCCDCVLQMLSLPCTCSQANLLTHIIWILCGCLTQKGLNKAVIGYSKLNICDPS